MKSEMRGQSARQLFFRVLVGTAILAYGVDVAVHIPEALRHQPWGKGWLLECNSVLAAASVCAGIGVIVRSRRALRVVGVASALGLLVFVQGLPTTVAAALGLVDPIPRWAQAGILPQMSPALRQATYIGMLVAQVGGVLVWLGILVWAYRGLRRMDSHPDHGSRQRSHDVHLHRSE